MSYSSKFKLIAFQYEFYLTCTKLFQNVRFIFDYTDEIRTNRRQI